MAIPQAVGSGRGCSSSTILLYRSLPVTCGRKLKNEKNSVSSNASIVPII